MDGKITANSLFLKAQVRLPDFFTKQAGFDKRTEVANPAGCHWVTVGLKGQALEFALWEVGSTVDESERAMSKKWSSGNAPPILLRVADCKYAYQEMSARAVEFVLARLEHPWGTVATLNDPGGNLFSMNPPPAFWPRR